MKINNYCGPLKKIRLNLLFIILVCFLISCGMIIATIPLHEGAHWVMSEIDPYIKPVELHLFDDTSFQNGEKVLSSALGCVIVKEAYPGAFLDRPAWGDALQEIICLTIQIVITCFVVLKTIPFLKKKYPYIFQI